MSRQDDLHLKSASELSKLLECKQVSCVQITQACLGRISEREADVGAWSFIDPEIALQQAADRDREPRRSAIHGIPIAVKDVIETADMPTEMGSRFYRGHRPVADAACVAKLREAGAVILGKTTTSEFAGSSAPATRNPLDLGRTPGGSSSGSAAAVADFMVPLALGTQTGGSVLRPASFCGIVGFKPTYGLFSTAGIKQAAASFDTLGFMGRTVTDVEMVNRALSRDDPLPFAMSGPPKIGVCRTPLWDSLSNAASQGFSAAIARAIRAGATVKDIDWPYWLESLPLERSIINSYERREALTYELNVGREQLSRQTIEVCERGALITIDQYKRAKRIVGSSRSWVNELFDDCDVLLTPCVRDVAPEGLEHTGDPALQEVWTALHLPTISVPAIKNPQGLPIGVQLVGNFYDDRRLLALGRWLLAALAC